MHHKLRTVWSLCCGLATVLLIVLWVRSYWRYEIISGQSFPHSVTLGASRGVAFINYARVSPDNREMSNEGWKYEPQAPMDLQEPLVFSYGDHLLIITPIWLPLVIAAIPALAPTAVYVARNITRQRHTNRRNVEAKMRGE